MHKGAVLGARPAVVPTLEVARATTLGLNTDGWPLLQIVALRLGRMQ